MIVHRSGSRRTCRSRRQWGAQLNTEPAATPTVEIRLHEERYPPYDAAHGTPDAMVRRLLTLRLPQGEATFEQTDYGHSGRFNPWEPRGIAPALQPRTDDLKALCAWVSSLLP